MSDKPPLPSRDSLQQQDDDLQTALQLSKQEYDGDSNYEASMSSSTQAPGSYVAPPSKTASSSQDKAESGGKSVHSVASKQSAPRLHQNVAARQSNAPAPATSTASTTSPSMTQTADKNIDDYFIANYLTFFGRHISSVSAAYSSSEAYKSYTDAPKLSDYAYKTEAQLLKERTLAAAKRKEEADVEVERKQYEDKAANDGFVDDINHETRDGADHEEGAWSSADVYSHSTTNLVDVQGEKEDTQKEKEKDQDQNQDTDADENEDEKNPQQRVDYLAYGLAWFLFKAEQYLPVELDQNPHQKFRYAKLVSNVERLYVNLSGNAVAEGMKCFGDVVMWKNRAVTFAVLVVYLILVMSDMLLNVALGGALIALVARRIFPPTSSSQLASRKDEHERAREIVELEEEYGLSAEGTNAPGKREKNMKEAYKAITQSHGREIQLVTGDLADFVEKMKNLYLWRNPKASRNFVLRALLPAIVGLQFISHAALVRGALAGLGLLVLVGIPITIHYPRYRRMAWNIPEVPTDAQYALSVMRERVRRNEPLPVLVDPFAKSNSKKDKAEKEKEKAKKSTADLSITQESDKGDDKENNTAASGDGDSDVDADANADAQVKSPKKGSKWSRLASSLKQGGKAAERGTDMLSQVVNGDKGVFVRQAREVWASRNDGDSERTTRLLTGNDNENDEDNSSVMTTKRSIGLEPSRLAYLPLKSSHFGILKSSPGTLVLSSSELTFKPFKGPNVVVGLDALVGISKHSSLRVGVEVSSGLEVSWEEGEEIKVMRLTNVARRDDAQSLSRKELIGVMEAQNLKTFPKQPIFQNSKTRGNKKVTKDRRWYKDVGLGFKTPQDAITGTYIDKKCPWTGEVSIRGRILTGKVVSTKMTRTIVIRREYLHYVPKYNRYEKRHKNLPVHASPAFRIEAGDSVVVGQCRPLSKTVRFNVLRVIKNKAAAKAFAKF
ncbi:hypothetical protein E3P84_02267 [Wallemia ichthyophaga]|nr:hypothetical protein E3P91_02495 [Wallemia ichthyophaga]TIB33190.1 hypothetical protein E3P84_02267 [Wallemia ichthyophaga]TIB41191.1 hypothetical protein E3P83_02220 [Wallemia ichthyophaga]TIB62713.1 hypothetical protein E3P78_02252 [Wallemia ichthyophaga]